MAQPADPNLVIVVPVVSGLFALLGGFVGAWLARRTEYEKWLRQERSAAFAEFLRLVHDVRLQALNTVYSADLTEQQRDQKVTELFMGLDAQENVVRLYLKSGDRAKFSELKKEFWILHTPSTAQARRISRSNEILSELQAIFERTIHG